MSLGVSPTVMSNDSWLNQDYASLLVQDYSTASTYGVHFIIGLFFVFFTLRLLNSKPSPSTSLPKETVCFKTRHSIL